MTETLQRFGELLRHFRRERGLSQLELGARSGVSARHISFLETGRADPSPAMVGKLGLSLDLGPRTIDDLRDAAGFSRRHPASTLGLGDRVFASAMSIERCSTLSQVVDAGRAILPELGVTQFFFGTLRGGTRPGLDWEDLGTFPTEWLRVYDRERHAATDPLLAVVRQGRERFFWEDVIDRRVLSRPARTLFEGAAARGIASGFVTARRRRRSAAILSMMGPALDHRDGAVRLALEVVGTRMLAGFERLGAS